MEQMLRITTTPARLSYDITRAKLDYTSPPSKINMERKPAELELHTEISRIQIDSRAMFNSMGLKDYKTITAEMIQKGEECAKNNAARIVQAGNSMMMPGNTPARIEAQSKRKILDMSIAFIPSEKPEISFTEGDVNVTYHPGELNVNPEIHPRPQGKYTPGKVDISLSQKPGVDIEYVGNNFDLIV